MRWIYIARPGGATAEDTEKLANELNFIWRNPYNQKQKMVANVRSVNPKDIMLLYFAEDDNTMRLLGIYKVLGGNSKHFRAVPDRALPAVFFYNGELNISELGYEQDTFLQESFKETHAGFVVKKLGIEEIPEELLTLPTPSGQNAIRDLSDLVGEDTSKELQRAIDNVY